MYMSDCPQPHFYIKQSHVVQQHEAKLLNGLANSISPSGRGWVLLCTLLLQPRQPSALCCVCLYVTYKEHVMVIISFFDGDDNLRM